MVGHRTRQWMRRREQLEATKSVQSQTATFVRRAASGREQSARWTIQNPSVARALMIADTDMDEILPNFPRGEVDIHRGNPSLLVGAMKTDSPRLTPRAADPDAPLRLEPG